MSKFIHDQCVGDQAGVWSWVASQQANVVSESTGLTTTSYLYRWEPTMAAPYARLVKENATTGAQTLARAVDPKLPDCDPLTYVQDGAALAFAVVGVWVVGFGFRALRGAMS